MKDNVILRITGLHTVNDEDDNVEMINAGNHYYRNGKHYIKYQESLDEGFVCDNMLKISPAEVEFIRKGAVNTHMIFTRGKKNMNYYETPFGSMTMGIDTSILEVSDTDEKLDIDIYYALEMNSEHLSDCHVSIKISEAM